jgi:hypothetical protein
MHTAWVMAMLRHLPPSASALHVVDVGGACSDVLTSQRSDLIVQTASLAVRDWSFAVSQTDAITIFDTLLTPDLLAACLEILRPGGRLIAVQPEGQVDASHGVMMERAGLVRLLVEAAVDGQGVLMRGERAHLTTNTAARVQVAAAQDADALALEAFKGRFIYLLIRQTPNKPPWKITPDDVVVWEAVTLADMKLLAFTSLPKAVAFLQQAVLQNGFVGISKVAKFQRDVPLFHHHRVVLNPTFESALTQTHGFLTIDPQMAEASDE